MAFNGYILRTEELRTQLRSEKQASEKEIVAASAQAIVNVKLSWMILTTKKPETFGASGFSVQQ